MRTGNPQDDTGAIPMEGFLAQDIDMNADDTMDRQKQKRLRVGDVYFFDFDRPGLEKPWLENRDKMEDYFNYGRFKLQINSIKGAFL